MTERWDESSDFIVVGSGAGAMSAALVTALAGKQALVLEKTELVGGSTAMSGGVLWVPNNPLQKRAGVPDSYEAAATYLDACIDSHGGPTRGSAPERRHAFLTEGPKTIEFLQRLGMKFLHTEGYSDYHEGELPGAMARSRSLVAAVFDARRLGDWRVQLRRNRTNKTGAPAMAHELPRIALNGRTFESKLFMARVGLRMARNRLGNDLVGFGAAVQGRLLKIALEHRIPIWTNAGVRELTTRDGRVTGVVAERNGKALRIEARRGVLLNAGGFAHNAAMRETYLPKPTSVAWTKSNPGETGEMLREAARVGASLELMDLAWWNPLSIPPNGIALQHPGDVTKPFSIMVDSEGRRFVSESTSYVDIGEAQYARQSRTPAVPAWVIGDRRFRSRYRWGGIYPPGDPPREWLTSGYCKVASSLEELARQCGISPQGLAATVARFNEFARAGRDEDYGRGGSAYHRFFGDPTVKPNPNLGPLEEPPFYAIQIFPGDVGTSGGIVTDECARALRDDDEPIAGLYACGNCTSPVVGRSYPGAGASIASSMVFGYVAAQHAMRMDNRADRLLDTRANTPARESAVAAPLR